jgi:hypothetical protein
MIVSHDQESTYGVLLRQSVPIIYDCLISLFKFCVRFDIFVRLLTSSMIVSQVQVSSRISTSDYVLLRQSFQNRHRATGR